MIETLMNRFLGCFTKQALQLTPAVPADAPPPADAGQKTLLYIHIPFCETLCPYCSFHRYAYKPEAAARYCAALLRELDLYKRLGHDFSAMYVGGGTPTVIGAGLMDILSAATAAFDIREISVETNPDFLTPDNVRRLRDAGVNRLSVGVQSFDDSLLKSIGRLEKYGSADRIAEKISQTLGIVDTLNMDLIFNFPHQNLESLVRDLDYVDRLRPDQVTFYPLMRSNHTRDSLTQTFGSMDYQKEKTLYFKILERIKKQYTHSTAWCFSRTGAMIDEYVVHYDTYIGAGSGAFGYAGGKIFVNTFCLDDYVRLTGSGKLPLYGTRTFSKRQALYYYTLMKLFGMTLDKNRFQAKFQTAVDRALFPELFLLKSIRVLTDTGTELCLTEKGSYLWVIAMREFFKAVDNLRDQCRRESV